jgi:universal stress protein A
MPSYRHILLASDFSDHGAKVAKQAHDLEEKYQAKLTLLHVVEYIPLADIPYAPMVPVDMDITSEMLEAAEQHLLKLAKTLNLSEESIRVEVGSPKVEIIRVAEETAADLIVLGSHGRHGIGLLLGSTASSVIHHAKCDVLAVRLRDA